MKTFYEEQILTDVKIKPDESGELYISGYMLDGQLYRRLYWSGQEISIKPVSATRVSLKIK